jgi:hypothetical protein
VRTLFDGRLLNVMFCAFPALLAVGFAVAVLAPVEALEVDAPVTALDDAVALPPSEFEADSDPELAFASDVEVVRLEASIGAKIPPLFAPATDPDTAPELDPELADWPKAGPAISARTAVPTSSLRILICPYPMCGKPAGAASAPAVVFRFV